LLENKKGALFMFNRNKFTQIVGIYGLILSLSNIIFIQNIANASSQKNSSISPVKVAQAQRNGTSNSNQQVLEDNDFRFQLLNCQRKSKLVTCNLLITNLSADRSLTIFPSRVFDSSGSEYAMKSFFLGNRTDGFAHSVVQGVPIKSSLTFEIPSEVTEFTLLEIPYNFAAPNIWTTAAPAKLQFRNIKITPSKSSGASR
jgi:hypothetical protein